jgi:hypothetical protein
MRPGRYQRLVVALPFALAVALSAAAACAEEPASATITGPDASDGERVGAIHPLMGASATVRTVRGLTVLGPEAMLGVDGRVAPNVVVYGGVNTLIGASTFGLGVQRAAMFLGAERVWGRVRLGLDVSFLGYFVHRATGPGVIEAAGVGLTVPVTLDVIRLNTSALCLGVRGGLDLADGALVPSAALVQAIRF